MKRAQTFIWKTAIKHRKKPLTFHELKKLNNMQRQEYINSVINRDQNICEYLRKVENNLADKHDENVEI